MENGVIQLIQMFVGIIAIQIVEIKKKLHKSQPALIQRPDGIVNDGTLTNRTNQIINLISVRTIFVPIQMEIRPLGATPRIQTNVGNTVQSIRPCQTMVVISGIEDRLVSQNVVHFLPQYQLTNQIMQIHMMYIIMNTRLLLVISIQITSLFQYQLNPQNHSEVKYCQMIEFVVNGQSILQR